MKLEQQLLKLLNSMPFLEGVQYNTENSKVMKLTNFCLTSSHALYHWRVVLHLDLRKLRRKSLKLGYMFVKGNELSDWSRSERLQTWIFFACNATLWIRILFVLQVPFSRSSLNHDDVFILDTKDKIFQFNGANSNIQERAKALEVIQFFKDKYHEGKCDVAIVGKVTCI